MGSRMYTQQEAISQKEIVFRFRKDIQSEKGWRFDILCMGSPGVKGICADALLCDSLSCQSLRLVVEARYSTDEKRRAPKKNSSFFDRYLPLPKDREEYSLKWV